jgi:hypothetical protein
MAPRKSAVAAWLSVCYHQEIHSETGQSPEERHRKGLGLIREVDMQRVMDSFLQSIRRTVNPTFSDLQVNHRYYRVDPKLRGDRVKVRFDPFSSWDQVKVHSLERMIRVASIPSRTGILMSISTTSQPKTRMSGFPNEIC